MTNRPTDDQIVDAYVYLVARYLVIRQERIDMAEPAVDYNIVKYNELGKAEFVNPNLDVAYLESWLALDADTPVVLNVPRVEGRYYTAQVCDEWAEIVTNINERNYPEHSYGEFAFCLAGSHPEIPEGAVRIDLPSRKAKILARVERQGDDAGAIELQRAFTVRSLGEPEIASAVDIPMFTNDALIGVGAFERPLLDAVLASAPDSLPSAAEKQAVVQAVADYVASSDEARDDIDQVLRQRAILELFGFVRAYGDKRGGWAATTGKLRGFGDDYWFRGAANLAGIWVNTNAEVVYYIGEKDDSGEELDGSSSYVIHYDAGDLPQDHVNAYWSLTLMSLPDYRVVPNALDRFNLNNIAPLELGSDGSLDIYLGASRPEGTPESNWLPAPDKRPFTLNHRFYVPKPEVVDGRWYVPPIRKL